ncbi:MAG: NUDIX domain-containing protein [Trueperaceae bacterium]
MDKTNPDSTACVSLFGELISIPTSQLFFRPCVYAVMIQNGKVLLVRNETTNKFSFPGGGINLGEPLHKALHREVREEVGIDIIAQEFLHFEEAFFYHNPTDEAMHTLAFFFRCAPLTLELGTEKVFDEGEYLTSEWVAIASLQPGDFQGTTGTVVPLLKAKWAA